MATITEIPANELPDWMRQAQRGIDWGIPLVFVFSILIALPFLTIDSLPHTNASENYVYRTADYATAFREGRLYPRWSPNALGGYGAPIPHYSPPGAAYIPAVIQALLTNDPILAVRIVFAVALGLSGVMVYLFVEGRIGAAAGLLAGVLYVYSPYVGLTAPHLLGDLPSVMSFALMPMLLWSVDRPLRRRQPADVLFIALATSGLYVTDIRAAVVSTILAALMMIWHQWTTRRVRWLQMLFSYILGLGVAGFYWIPAFLESDAIHWRTATIPTSFNLTLPSLLAPPQPIDLSSLVHPPQFSLGIGVILFGLVGLVTVIHFRKESRFQAFFLTMGVIIGAVSLVFFPHEVWLLGAITLCLAIGGSAVLKWQHLLPKKWQRLFLPTLLIVVWITSITVWLPPLANEPFGSTDARTQAQYELQGYGVAVIPPNEAIPSTIADDLIPTRSLIESYQADNINKIPAGQFSASFIAGILEHESHSDRFQVRSSAPITLNILTAFFPGWRATVSDQIMPLRPDPLTGLIQIDLPAIRTGELFVTMGTTPVRLGAWIIVGACMLMVVVITWGKLRRQRITYYEDAKKLSYPEVRLLTIMLACFAIIIVLFNNPSFPLMLRPRPGYSLQNSSFVQNRTDTGLSLLAFRLEKNQYRPGEKLSVTLFWQAQRFLSENYRVQVYLTNNRDNRIWAQSDLHHPGNYPTRRWKTGLSVPDGYTFTMPSETPPGNYQINIQLSTCNPDCASGRKVTFFNIDGQLIGTTLILPTLVVIGR